MPDPTSDRTPDIRTDDGAGMRIAMRAGNPSASAFANPSMGFGTGRDPTTHTVVNRPARLTDGELEDLYCDGIIAKIVDCYPDECADVWMKYTFTRQTSYRGYGVDGAQIEDYLDNRVQPDELDPQLSMSSVRELFRDQSKEARVYRSAYILIDLDDGREFFEPIDAQNIKSIECLEPLSHLEIYPDSRGLYKLSHGRELGQSLLVHPSRLIKFSGKPRLKALKNRRGFDDDYSAIDGVFRALSRSSQSLDALTYYIQTASVFDYGLDGFSDIRDTEDEQAIALRMQSVMFALSALRIFIRDNEKESMSTVTRNFGGVGDAIDRITDSICYYTDIPRHVLFGSSSQKGLGNQGKEGIEERQWDDQKIAWRSRHWLNHYLYLGKLACLAQDSPTGGRLPKGLGVEVPSGLKRSETDKLTNLKTFAESVNILITNKILDPIEARQAFSGDEANYTLTLDERISDRLNAQLEAEQDMPLLPPQEPPLEGEVVDEPKELEAGKDGREDASEEAWVDSHTPDWVEACDEEDKQLTDDEWDAIAAIGDDEIDEALEGV